jgi:AraC-like DNA-binding protein
MFNIIFFGQDQEHYDLPSTLLGKSEVINVLNCKEAEELYTLYTLYKSNEIHLILMEVRHNAEQCKHIVQSLQALRIIDSPIILFNVSNLLEYHDLYDCGVLQIIPKSLPKVLLNSIIRTHLKYTNIKLQYSLSKAISSNDDINQNEMQFTKSLFALIQENLFNSQLNVNLLAESLGFSRRQLLRKCYQVFGKTAFEVLDDTRLRLIHEMVQQHNISIRTIAENVGYNSPYYLEKKYAEFLEQLDQDDSH